MDQVTNFIFSTSFLGLAVAIIIFIITLALLVKRIIGFFITLLLLAFTIVSGYAVINHEIISKALEQYFEGRDSGAIEELKRKVAHDIDELKDQINIKVNEAETKTLDHSQKLPQPPKENEQPTPQPTPPLK